MKFTYTAITNKGLLQGGTVVAPNSAAARARLAEYGLRVTNVEMVKREEKGKVGMLLAEMFVWLSAGIMLVQLL